MDITKHTQEPTSYWYSAPERLSRESAERVCAQHSLTLDYIVSVEEWLKPDENDTWSTNELATALGY